MIPASKAIAAGSNASQSLAAAAVCTRKAWRTPRLEARPSKPIACAIVRRAGAQAQAPALRGVHTESAPRAWPARDRGGSQGARSPGCRGHGPACERAGRAQARRGECRASSPQSSLGARASGPARRGVVRARDRAEARRFSLKEIGKATGLSLAACSRIRAGRRVPHARHWAALRELVDS